MRARLPPFEDPQARMEATLGAARAAAQAALGLQPLCGREAQALIAAVERVLSAETATDCDTTFEDVYRRLRICCDASLI